MRRGFAVLARRTVAARAIAALLAAFLRSGRIGAVFGHAFSGFALALGRLAAAALAAFGALTALRTAFACFAGRLAFARFALGASFAVGVTIAATR
ncbi:MAG TPA: hypothetical protein VH105_22270, partial [Burkholderiales bacterium]|nr:hypothetical protein [Burkholderiales bacterium]